MHDSWLSARTWPAARGLPFWVGALGGLPTGVAGKHVLAFAFNLGAALSNFLFHVPFLTPSLGNVVLRKYPLSSFCSLIIQIENMY